MAWTVKLSDLAKKNLKQLDPQIATPIFIFLDERLAKRDNPRSIGEALSGAKLGELWKYRVGDYRIIAKIEDQSVSILVVRIGNRREVYR
jgi:mRNA interferase RelE/StbE